MKLWIDDVRPAPKGYYWVKTVDMAKDLMDGYYGFNNELMIEEINLDHDAGDYKYAGGDYIELLNWMENAQYIFGFNFSKILFKFHSMNPVGVNNMKRICERNGWNYVS